MFKMLLKIFKKLFGKAEPQKVVERQCKWCRRHLEGVKQKKFCNESCKKKYYYFFKVKYPN